MSRSHDTHDHSHHDDTTGGHSHGNDAAPRRRPLTVSWRRAVIGGFLVLIAVAAASLIQVHSGEAVVVTRFGNPVRVLMQPGLNWRWPAPFEQATSVDLRLKTTSSGLQDVGTKDGLRIIVSAYVGWQVDPDPAGIERFMRAVGNQPDEAGAQLRSFVGSALETAASGYDLANLINTDKSKVEIGRFEEQVRQQIAKQVSDAYGVRIVQLGLQNLSLPSVALNATIERMSAERRTVATERAAAGREQAAALRAAAERDARMTKADAEVKAADIEAKSISEAAAIYGKAYRASPQLYRMLRSIDTLGTIINSKTRLILRTDAAPFNALVDGPPTPAAASPATGKP